MKKLELNQMENLEGGLFGNWITDDPCQAAAFDYGVAVLCLAIPGAGIASAALVMAGGASNIFYNC